MIAFNAKTAMIAAGALLIFLLAVAPGPPAPGRVTKTLEIDDNVFSDTFGQPIASTTATDAPAAADPTMAALIKQSNAVIAANPD